MVNCRYKGNSTFGASKDEYNDLYDPLMANNVCIAGQLLLLDLIEKIEACCKVVQSNTDGVFVKIESEENKVKFMEECNKWSKRVRMDLEYDEYCKVIQKDVNNYIIVDKKGKYKSKGAYVKELKKIDYDLPIINEALINYFIYNKPIKETIMNCNDFIKFQKIVKITRLYNHAFHNDKIIKERVLRVFASKNDSDGTVYKVKNENKYEKISNTPERAFIYNENVNDMECLERLDKEYYVKVANDRLEQFLNKSNKSHLTSGIKYVSYESFESVKNSINDYFSFDSFLENMTCSNKELEILMLLDYFKDYGTPKKLITYLKYYKLLKNKSKIKKEKCDELILKHLTNFRETKTTYVDFNSETLLNQIWKEIKDEEQTLDEIFENELKYYGRIKSDIPNKYIICKVDSITSWSVKLTSLSNGKSEFFKTEDKSLKKDDVIRILQFDKTWNKKKEKYNFELVKYKKLG